MKKKQRHMSMLLVCAFFLSPLMLAEKNLAEEQDPGSSDVTLPDNSHIPPPPPSDTDTSSAINAEDLLPLADPYANSVVAYETGGFSNTHTDPTAVLGHPCKGPEMDLSLGGGWVTVDMGLDEDVIDGPGADLVVFESESLPYCNGGGASPYEVLVWDPSDGSWKSIGTGTGVTAFDFGPYGIANARWIHIVDRSAGQPDHFSTTPGADIAGLQALHMADTYADLQGIVIDGTTGESLLDVQIRITGPVQRTTTADDTGAYSFQSIPTGLYAFEAIKSQYDPVSTQVAVEPGSENVHNPVMFPVPDIVSQMAALYAPIWYQDTDDTDWDADCITNFDFDGDWTATNNWENQDDNDLRAYVYWAVSKTQTHWFITYADFHPRDWGETGIWSWLECTGDGLDDWRYDLYGHCHENDMEGALIVVEDDDTPYGSFLLMETNAHGNWNIYSNNSTLRSHNDDVDPLILSGTHPEVFAEAKGHGLFARDEGEFPGGDGIIYRLLDTPSDTPDPPASGNDRNARYALQWISEEDGLWFHRCDPSTFLIEHGICTGTFLGDNYADNRAHAPWGWGGDGEIFRDPAEVVADQLDFDGLGEFSDIYERNNYDDSHALFTAGTGGTLISFDARVRIRIPGAAADDDLVISVSISGSLPLAGDLVGLTSFDLYATVLQTGAPVTDFSVPFEISVRYLNTEAANVDEGTLSLYYWDGNSWVPEPTSVVDTENNVITAMPSHMSSFAILGIPRYFVFLPLVTQE